MFICSTLIQAKEVVMARRKKKSLVWLVMILVTDEVNTQGKVVQVEVKAPDDRRARSEALTFARSVYKKDGEKQGYYIKALSSMNLDGVLENNSVLDYKPDEVLTRGNIGRSVVNSLQKVKPAKHPAKALVPAVTAPPVVRVDYSPLENPMTEAVVKALKRHEVLYYDKDNRVIGEHL